MQRRNVVQLDFGQIVEDDICLNALLITDGLTAAVAAAIVQSKAKAEYVIKFVMAFILEMGRTQCTLLHKPTDSSQPSKLSTK